jgi:preprotein translocase subunit SecA
VAGLMERMGLEGDVAIESRLVSKTIENAQSRVEGYNFDIRKRVVEYDDVINKQRETIYSERDKVLRNEDLSEAVLDFVQRELEVLIEQHLGPIVDEWDLEGLARSIHQLGIAGDELDADGLAELGSRQEIVDHLLDAAEATLEERSKRYGEETWATVERLILLRSIDSLWVDHLTELDDFRRGVGLRGYGGTDPLVEFKREAFKLYEELRGFIRHQVASTIFRVNVQVQPATPPPARSLPMPTPEQLAMLRASSAAASAAAASAAGFGGNVPASGGPNGSTRPPTAATPGSAQAPAVAGPASGAHGAQPAPAAAALIPGLGGSPRPGGMRLQHGDEAVDAPKAATQSGTPKLGRNDICYCGSGLKYKKCHGR